MSRAYKQFIQAVKFLDECDTNFEKTKSCNDYCEWSNTVTIKLDASDYSDVEYKNKFGVDFMDENTLIVGDEMNNVLLVYQDKDRVITKNITPMIHVLNKLRMTPECIVHKMLQPSETPLHVKINLNFIQNNIQNNTIQNNFNNLRVSPTCTDNAQCIKPHYDFFEKNFRRGGMMPVKEMKMHPEWKTEYIGQVNLKDFNMCKSCKKRAFSGCCPKYSASNRIKVRMVLGWHQEDNIVVRAGTRSREMLSNSE